MTENNFQSESSPVPGVTLPKFVDIRPEGVFVLSEFLQFPADFSAYLDRLFSNGERFAEVDLELVQTFLYDDESLAYLRNANKSVRIASSVVPFDAMRGKLYRPVKMLESGKRAEYLFEPLTIEVIHQEAVYDEPDENGLSSIVEYQDVTVDVPTRLTFDEFFAAMWLKGIKYGIDEATIREGIQSNEAMRRTIARQLDPTMGRDAEIQETSPDLHRDNSPKILANGKADLSQFKNRFPQMEKGTSLLKKIPRVLGKQGRTLAGSVIEPKLPKDLDLYALTSVGTKVEDRDDGEYIVATIDGFLTLDPKSNQVSVTEKIENKGGISVKTTGDLVLSVDEFIEHGEVQEGRVVKGRNMTFLSDVYGRVMSEGGNIYLKKNLSGGVADTFSGDIELSGNASRAFVRSADGEVAAKFCESSTLIGKRVRVEHAVSCEIVADEIEAGTLEGCTIAAKKIYILNSDERRGKENLVTLLIPDLSGFDQIIKKLKNDIDEARARLANKTRQLDMLKTDNEFAKFLVLAENIRKGAIKITPEQAVNWRKLVEKHAKAYAISSKLIPELEELNVAIAQNDEALVVAELEKTVSCAGITCRIDHVNGLTRAQTLCSASGANELSAMQPSSIRETLQRMDASKEIVYSDDDGEFDWQFAGA